MGLAGIASAAKAKATAPCAKHAHKKACAKGGGGATGSGSAPNIIVSVAPNPVQEVGTSEVDVIVQVSAQPIFANQMVDISSQQLFLDCFTLAWFSSADGITSDLLGTNAGVTGVLLDNDGNATVELQGEDCAQGQDLVEADLAASPYTTATATLRAVPPGITAEPTITAFPNPEVETGDGAPGNAESQVYTEFLIEENPVYAEQTVEVTSAQLTNRCELGTALWSSTGGKNLWDRRGDGRPRQRRQRRRHLRGHLLRRRPLPGRRRTGGRDGRQLHHQLRHQPPLTPDPPRPSPAPEDGPPVPRRYTVTGPFPIKVRCS